MLKKIKIGIAFFLTTLAADAQDSLSLAEAIEVGLEKNFSVRIEKFNAQIAENNNSWGEAGRYPSINFIMGQNNSRAFRKPTFPNAPTGLTTNNNFTSQVDLQWVLFNGFMVNINKNMLEELERQSLGNVSIVLENTIQNIILGYYLAVVELRRLDAIERVLKLSKERYELVKLRREVGSAIKFDVLQEENAYLTDSSTYLSQQLVVKNAFRNLNETLNEDLNKTYILTDSLQPIMKDYKLDDLSEKMLTSNSNLRNQFINQSLLKYNVQLAQSSAYPTISLNTGMNTSNDRLYAESRSEPGVFAWNYGRLQNAYLNFSLRFNVFNGGEIKRGIQNARIQERMGELSTQELKLSLTNDLQQFYDLYNVRKNLVQLADANIKAAELNVSLANERYRNGYLSAIDYRFIQLTYLNTALASLEAIYNVIETHTDLLRITGGIINNYEKPE